MKSPLPIACLLAACLPATLWLAAPAPAQVWEEWVSVYSAAGPSYDRPEEIVLDSQCNVYVVGRIAEGGDNANMVTIKYNSAGVQQWAAIYDGPPQGSADWGWGIALDASLNVYVTGQGYVNYLDDDFITIKYSPNGQQLWMANYSGIPGGVDLAYDIAVDENGNAYVTGQSSGLGTTYDYATVKYDSLGNLLWATRYDGPVSGWDRSCALVLDDFSNVYVTGRSAGAGGYYDYATIKYNNEGEMLWVTRYDGPAHGGDEPEAIAVDRQGNVYVTGACFWDGPSDHDYLTVKYDSEGNEIWIARYNGPFGWSGDKACDVALDPDENIIVTGSSNGDYLTVKYDSLGQELWEVRNVHAGPYGDVAYDLAIDDAGNAYVTGGAREPGDIPYDYLTIKYDRAGHEIWSMRYNSHGLSGQGDLAKAIAVGADGNVYVTGESDTTIGAANENIATIKYGQWQSNEAPQIVNYQPASLDSVLLGGFVIFWASATDPDGDSLLWQWRLDSAVVATDSFCTITFNELGEHRIVCTVSDGELADNVVWDVVVVPLEATHPNLFYPLSFILYPSFPNPFNLTTILSFQLPVVSYVKLEILDITGRVVGARHASPLRSGSETIPTTVWVEAGLHEIPFDASGLPSGIYICRIEAGEWSATQKLVLLK